MRDLSGDMMGFICKNDRIELNSLLREWEMVDRDNMFGMYCYGYKDVSFGERSVAQ